MRTAAWKRPDASNQLAHYAQQAIDDSTRTISPRPANRSRKRLESFAPLGPRLSGSFFCAVGHRVGCLDRPPGPRPPFLPKNRTLARFIHGLARDLHKVRTTSGLRLSYPKHGAQFAELGATRGRPAGGGSARQAKPTGFFPSGLFPQVISQINSPLTGARHYLHFEEIIGHGERAPFGVSHWPGWRWAEGRGTGMPDLFFSQTQLFV